MHSGESRACAERLSVATGDYAHTRLLAGVRFRTGEASFVIDWRPDVPGTIFRQAFSDGAPFDVAEMSLATAWTLQERGEAGFVPVAVFPSRMYRLSGFYVRPGFDDPRELRGARIGVVRYGQTASVWARAFLHREFGIEPADCEWWVGERQAFSPRGVELHEAHGAAGLAAMLEAGELACFFSAQAPPGFAEGRIVRLFADWAARERRLFEARGEVPPMHTVVVRRSLVDHDPGFASALVRTFDDARDRALEWLTDTDASSLPVPLQHAWLDGHGERLSSFWASGLDGNRDLLDAFADHMHAQGLVARRYAPAEVFPFG